MKKTINSDDREWLYGQLIKVSDFPTRIEDFRRKISLLLREFIKKYLISKEDLELYKKSREILRVKNNILIDIIPLFVDKNYSCLTNIMRFPNKYIPRLDFKDEINNKVYIGGTFKLNIKGEEELIIPNCIYPENKINESFIFGENEFSKIPDNEISSLKNLLLDYYNVIYDHGNYLIDYFKEKSFIGNITTMDQLKNLNKDWYDILLNKFKEDDNSLKEKRISDLDTIISQYDIEKSLKNIKKFIESKELLYENPLKN